MLILTGLIAFVLFAGCKTNLFSPFHNADSDTSLDSLLWDGKAAMENLDFEKAEEYYGKAMEDYPHSGAARLGHAAAYIALKEINILDLYKDLDLSDETVADTESLFPRNRCALYRDGAFTVDTDLNPILNGSCDLSPRDGETNLNIAFTSLLLGALQIYDMDGNGNFMESHEVLYLGKDMNVYGFELFATGGLTAGEKSTIVNNLNARIDDVTYYIHKSTTAINYAVEALEMNDEDPEMLNEINSIANSVSRRIAFYRYKDEKDNDDDWLDVNEDVVADTMVWTDTDGDGFIDDATDTPWTWDRVNALTFPLSAGWFTSTGGEWEGGDWGIDEEDIDGRDNDSDGIIDEDSGGVI